MATAIRAAHQRPPCDILHKAYGVGMQIPIVMAGLTMPVYAKSLRAKGDVVPSFIRDDDIVRMPGLGDKALDNLYDAAPDMGNPLYERDQSKLCLVITPPIPGFRYDKCIHGIEVCVDDLIDYDDEPGIISECGDDVVTARCGYVPPGFVDNARHVQALALEVVAQETLGAQFEVLGARLNPLASGLANVLMVLEFPRGCPFAKQTYIPVPFCDMKVRVVPRPIIVKTTDTRFWQVDVRIKVLGGANNEVFDDVYPHAEGIVAMLGPSFVKLKHQRVDKATKDLVIQGHSLYVGDTSPATLTRVRKHVVGLLSSKYIVQDVSFEVSVSD